MSSKRYDPTDVWTLTFRPEAGYTVPMATRIRRLLKMALRACGCRCVKVWPAGQEPAAPGQSASSIEDAKGAAER